MAQVRLIEPINKANGTLPLPPSELWQVVYNSGQIYEPGEQQHTCTNTKYLKSVLGKTLPTHMKYVYEAVTKSFK